jgi:predicted transcriptional regulator
MNKSKVFNLKQSELNVLNVLWNENQPLMSSEIAKKGGLINSTVQLALRNLMKNEIVRVIDVVINVTSLSRKYIPNLTKEEYESILLTNKFKKIVNESMSNPFFVATLLKDTDIKTVNSEIDILQNLINELREEIKKKEDL